MDVLEAIKTRKSIRAFTDQEVSQETIEKLLEISQRSPSGTNTQPWQVYVCTGDARQAITDDVLALAAEGKAKKYEDYDYYPAKWSELHNSRRRGVGWGLYGLLGIEKGDREAMAKQGRGILNSSMRRSACSSPPIRICRTAVGRMRVCIFRRSC